MSCADYLEEGIITPVSLEIIILNYVCLSKPHYTFSIDLLGANYPGYLVQINLVLKSSGASNPLFLMVEQ